MAARAGRLIIPGFILGAIIRIVLLPLPGTPDVGSWKTWSFAASTDATSLYGVGGNPPQRRLMNWRGIQSTTEYPPLALYELAIAGRVYAAIDPSFADSRVLTVLVKMPGILAEMAVVFALVGSLILALTLMPVLASIAFRKHTEEREPRIVHWLKDRYRPILGWTLGHPRVTGGAAAGAL